MSQRQREHCVEFIRAFEEWKAKNLSHKVCFDLAQEVALRKCPLEPDEQAAVDEYLAGRFTPEPEQKAERRRSLFDDVPWAG